MRALRGKAAVQKWSSTERLSSLQDQAKYERCIALDENHVAQSPGVCTIFDSINCKHMLAVNAIICEVNKKQLKTLNAIFAKPTLPSVVFADIEALIISLGGAIQEREGSRIKITLHEERWHCHRPHPGKEAKRYQVEEARDLLERVGVKP